MEGSRPPPLAEREARGGIFYALMRRELNGFGSRGYHSPCSSISMTGEIRKRMHEAIVPNQVLEDIAVPNCTIRTFSPDGTLLLCISRSLSALCVFDVVSTTHDDDAPAPLSGEFPVWSSFFSPRYEAVLTSSSEHLLSSFCLFVPGTPFVLLASTARIETQELAAQYTIIVIELATGRVMSRRSFDDDLLSPNHSSVFLLGTLLSIQSFRHQSVRVLQVTPAGGLVDVRSVGRTLYDDDDLFMMQTAGAAVPPRTDAAHPGAPQQQQPQQASQPGSPMNAVAASPRAQSPMVLPGAPFFAGQQHSQAGHVLPPPEQSPTPAAQSASHADASDALATWPEPSRSPSPPPMPSPFLQRIHTFLHRRAARDGSLDHFFQLFSLLETLMMVKAQLLDSQHLLIKLRSVKGAQMHGHKRYVAPPPPTTSFGPQPFAVFVVYNFITTEIVNVYDQGSHELCALLCDYGEYFRGGVWNGPASVFGPGSGSTSGGVSGGAGGAPGQSPMKVNYVWRALSTLPYSAQTISVSPYVDRALFSYDERFMSPSDRPKQCPDPALRFYSRRTGRVRFRMIAGPPQAPVRMRHTMKYVFHPFAPLVISTMAMGGWQSAAIKIHYRSTRPNPAMGPNAAFLFNAGAPASAAMANAAAVSSPLPLSQVDS